MDKTLNATEVKELFDKEAVLFGASDGVTLQRAKEIFGAKAADWANGLSKTRAPGYSSEYCCFDFACRYLTFKGFQYAATFANVETIRDQGGEELY